MAGPSDASQEHSAPRLPPTVLVVVIRWVAVLATVLLSLGGLVWVALRLFPDWLPAGAWTHPYTGVGLVVELIILLGALLAGMVVLAGLRRWEARIARAREARYKAWARERQEAQREQAAAAARVEAERIGGTEAVLVLDLIQSTELIRERGDEFFRDLLRRIETAFIPVAREYGTRCVDGHGDGFLFCFERVDQALEAVQGMYARLPGVNQLMPPGVEVAFRASLHVGPTFTDTRGNRTGLAVLKTVRLGAVMESLYGRGAGRNSLVISHDALSALGPKGASAKLLGNVALRGFPGTHPVYQIEV
ncbi:MAG TPA: adenylate/guanylate cyclase domain-containing protein [Methylomirabilota bacterium]|jgi:class 3 adenylate cyclase|nr:adenylate/guanylate cyclase domain-containing protein [Methylomirabilota bacterium]